MKKKILVVDDDREAVELLEEILTAQNFRVISARNGDEAIKKVREEKPDGVVLDAVLPGLGGLDVCRILKQDKVTHPIPIIMVSGKVMETRDKVAGFEAGADDYLTKPFEATELVARIRSLLRRYELSGDFEEVIEKEGISLDVDRATVRVKGKLVNLRPKEFDLLYLLMKKAGRVLSRSYLLASIWGYEYFGATRTVDVHIRRLREKLGEQAARKIKTIEGKGYMFVEGE
ncbi:response regulator transcription factor [bacterium]|nr:response regulator transcription factor [bacterium]